MSGCGADILANEISEVLLNGENFEVPMPDFSGDEFKVPPIGTDGIWAPIVHLQNSDLTTRTLDGDGTFDYLMSGFNVHLKREFEQNRITGEQYAKAYIALTEGAMANATQFLLGKDASYWAAVNAQFQAQRAQVEVVTARIQLESEKTRLQVLRIEAHSRQAEFALNKMRLATQSIDYCIAKFKLDELMPQEKALMLKQLERATAEIEGVNKQNDLLDENIIAAQNENLLHDLKTDMLLKQITGITNQNSMTLKQIEVLQKDLDLWPTKKLMLEAQLDNQMAQTANVEKQTENIQKDIDLFPLKESMLQEQMESQRAQTLDTRTDGITVTGTLGKQKELYTQQITSYKRDAEVKAGKMFTDAWITMKTIDEGLLPPTAFSNANLDTILTTIKTVNNL